MNAYPCLYIHLVVLNEVVDGIKAHLVNEVVFGPTALRLGVDTTVVVPAITSATDKHNTIISTVSMFLVCIVQACTHTKERE